MTQIAVISRAVAKNGYVFAEKLILVIARNLSHTWNVLNGFNIGMADVFSADFMIFRKMVCFAARFATFEFSLMLFVI